MNIARMQPILVTVVLLIVAIEVTGKSTDGTNERFGFHRNWGAVGQWGSETREFHGKLIRVK